MSPVPLPVLGSAGKGPRKLPLTAPGTLTAPSMDTPALRLYLPGCGSLGPASSTPTVLHKCLLFPSLTFRLLWSVSWGKPRVKPLHFPSLCKPQVFKVAKDFSMAPPRFISHPPLSPGSCSDTRLSGSRMHRASSRSWNSARTGSSASHTSSLPQPGFSLS